jgi:hypothetical protein
VNKVQNGYYTTGKVNDNNQRINNDRLEIFLKIFYKRHPENYDGTLILYYYEFEENFDYLKSEVMDNLINLDNSSRDRYLEKITFEIKRAVSNYKDDAVDDDYRNLLKELKMEYLPINELMTVRGTPFKDNDYNTFLDYEFDPMDSKEIRKVQKDKESFYSRFEQFFLLFSSKIASYFTTEILKFINEQQGKKEVSLTVPEKSLIKWNGNKNVLADIFKQLKRLTDKKTGEPLIANSYEDLAVFLKSNFDVFSETELSTIQTTLKQNSSIPKTTNRIIIETGD